MSSSAYHAEALRKARIQERAREARQNIMKNAASENGTQKPFATRTTPGTYPDQPSGPYDQQAQLYYIEKGLRQKEKVLRNHNLVMGPMSAFMDGQVGNED